MGDQGEIISGIYGQVVEAIGKGESAPEMPHDAEERLREIAGQAESRKAALAVLATLLTQKIYDPGQDIRMHQDKLPGGFSGRGVDTKYITPFLKEQGFPAMDGANASGWLTRSFEQSQPFNLNFSGAISPKSLKAAFLGAVNDVQNNGLDPAKALSFLFHLLIAARDSKQIDLAKPHNLPIGAIVTLLGRHFTHKYKGASGASRLPVLAIYAAYQCMMGQVRRYEGKKLLGLEPHTSADMRSGHIGDIDIDNPDGTPFEGVEIKHEVPITQHLVMAAYDKFKGYKTERYYILTTAEQGSGDMAGVEAAIQKVAAIHGCQVIANGVYPTLKYYLRLLKDPAEFIDKYVELLKADKAVKYPHRAAWNELVSL